MIYFGQELGEKAGDAEGFSGNDGRTTILIIGLFRPCAGGLTAETPMAANCLL